MKAYAMYLRKSRKDMEAERNGVDTLARHEDMLQSFAKQAHFPIKKIYREVVSGDTIAARPQMQQLLRDVENEIWKGVLVVDVERLARGDTIDQGIIAQVFKYSGTLIITPFKTYDPNNEYDEEFFEYGLFQARREYKAITRRQQRGRIQALKEGKWPYNKAPFGYERYKLPDQRGWSLRVVPNEARIVEKLFRMYCDEHIGYSGIAQELNRLQISFRGHEWSYNTVKDILTNVVYTGKVKNASRGIVKKTEDGAVVYSRPRNRNYDIYDGLHEAIISEELFQRVQSMFASHPSKPVGGNLTVRNPLAGLVYCRICGKKMVRRPLANGKTMIVCRTKSCGCISCYESILEQTVFQFMETYLKQIKVQECPVLEDNVSILTSELELLENEIETLSMQLDKIYELLEQGLYSEEVFLKRRNTIQEKMAEKQEKKEILQHSMRQEQLTQSPMIPSVIQPENLSCLYSHLIPEDKNAIFSELIESIIYLKTKRSGKNGPYDEFTLELYPQIPFWK